MASVFGNDPWGLMAQQAQSPYANFEPKQFPQKRAKSVWRYGDEIPKELEYEVVPSAPGPRETPFWQFGAGNKQRRAKEDAINRNEWRREKRYELGIEPRNIPDYAGRETVVEGDKHISRTVPRYRAIPPIDIGEVPIADTDTQEEKLERESLKRQLEALAKEEERKFRQGEAATDRAFRARLAEEDRAARARESEKGRAFRDFPRPAAPPAPDKRGFLDPSFLNSIEGLPEDERQRVIQRRRSELMRDRGLMPDQRARTGSQPAAATKPPIGLQGLLPGATATHERTGEQMVWTGDAWEPVKK